MKDPNDLTDAELDAEIEKQQQEILQIIKDHKSRMRALPKYVWREALVTIPRLLCKGLGVIAMLVGELCVRADSLMFNWTVKESND